MHCNKLINLVGNTPLLRWDDLFLKMEMFNPSGSIKDRPASLMLDRLLRNGIIKEKDTIICPTSGNMGISLAYFGKYYKVNIIIVMPEDASIERIKIIKSLGAKLILTDKTLGMKGSIDKAKYLSNINGYYYFDQFGSMFNVLSHYQTLLEIVKEIPNINYIVCGIGTGGTYIGLSQMVKKCKLDIKIIGVEALNQSVVYKYINHLPVTNKEKENGVPGINSNSISTIIIDNIKDVDIIKTINNLDVFEYFKEVNNLGLRIGISACASMLVAKKIKEENQNSNIVVIVPDGIDRYYSDICE